MNRRGLFWGITLAVIALDRVTKLLVPGLPAEGTVLIPGVIGLRYAENRGIAFSLLSGYPRLLGVLSLVLIIAGYLWLRKKKLGSFPLTGLALMAGGAAGNMIDRLISGYVPDMIETLFVSFPIFNIADSCLTVGCVLANLLTGLAVWDVVFGSVATLIGAVGTRLLKNKPLLAWIPPVLSNMVIVPIILIKVYAVPDAWWFLVLTVGAGEVLSCGVLGLLLWKSLKSIPALKEMK